jgi:hypothetical protein
MHQKRRQRYGHLSKLPRDCEYEGCWRKKLRVGFAYYGRQGMYVYSHWCERHHAEFGGEAFVFWFDGKERYVLKVSKEEEE